MMSSSQATLTSQGHSNNRDPPVQDVETIASHRQCSLLERSDNNCTNQDPSLLYEINLINHPELQVFSGKYSYDRQLWLQDEEEE